MVQGHWFIGFPGFSPHLWKIIYQFNIIIVKHSACIHAFLQSKGLGVKMTQRVDRLHRNSLALQSDKCSQVILTLLFALGAIKCKLWRIPWTEEPGRLQSTELKRLSAHTHSQQAWAPQHPGVFLPLPGCGFLCSEHLLILYEALLCAKSCAGQFRACSFISSCVATMENSIEGPQKLKTRTTVWSSNPTSGCTSEGNLKEISALAPVFHQPEPDNSLRVCVCVCVCVLSGVDSLRPHSL